MEASPVDRRLAAILAADIAGYSRLVPITPRIELLPPAVQGHMIGIPPMHHVRRLIVQVRNDP